jgi:hypothetical protein
MQIKRLFLIEGLVVSLAFGQLHLLTGSPDEKHPQSFASALYRLEEDGTVKMTAELVPEDVGTEWIGVYNESRKAVLFLGYKDGAVLVVDFDKAAIVKKCKPPEVRGMSLIYSWLADAPVVGPSFEWLDSGSVKDNLVTGMVLDPSVPCERSFAVLPPEAVQYMVADGRAGPDDGSSRVGMGFDPEEPGNVTAFVGKHVALGYKIPPEFRSGPRLPYVSPLINDSQVFAIGMSDRQGNYQYLIFRKRDKTWHTFPVVSERRPYVRGFGRYISAAEVKARTTRNPKSAGQDKWRKVPGKMGPATQANAYELGIVLPGRLYLYDVDTERVLPITTNEGDSEVLLVENNVVYYRVNDQLFSAFISEKGVGHPRLLATDEAIRDAHWAFMKH